MKQFNYQDYLIYQELKKREVKGLAEESTPYKLEMIRVNKPHDKIFKLILAEKKQAIELINKVLNLSPKLTENEIERYSTEHIDYLLRESASDFVYKMKQMDVFFLLEHQSTIDYNMPKRILEYEVEIIKEAVKGKRLTKKNHKLPMVIPIVIYTGSRRWNVEKYIQDCQVILKGVENVKLGEYYVIDVNDYSNEELENDELFLSKVLLLEKLKREEDIIQVLDRIIHTEKDSKNQQILKRVIAFILKGKISDKNIEKLMKKLEREEPDMVIEVLQKENERQRKIGIREGIKQATLKIAKKMLQSGIKLEEIEKVTGLTKEEIKRTSKRKANNKV